MIYARFISGVTIANAAIVRAPLYGSINDFAYYFLDISVGTPPTRQSVILDSGSSLLGFPCLGCGRKCGRHLDQPYDLARSTSAVLYSCSDPRCLSQEQCPVADASCLYTQVYSEGSSIEGFFFSDTVSLSPTGANAVRYDYIGCHTKETVLFTTQQASGILGVSFPKNGKQPTVMDSLLSVADKPIFSLCAAEDGGSLTIGGYDEHLHAKSWALEAPQSSLRRGKIDPPMWAEGPYRWVGDFFSSRFGRAFNSRGGQLIEQIPSQSRKIVYTKILNHQSYAVGVSNIYRASKDPQSSYINLRPLVVGGFGETLVDSGTTYTYFPNDVFERVARELFNICQENNAKPELLRPGTCVKSKADLICFNFKEPPTLAHMALIPSFFIQFADGGVTEWGPESWLFRKTDRVWCSAVENNRRPQTILGMSFMKEKQVVFDREQYRIGFVRANCPKHVPSERNNRSESLDLGEELAKINSHHFLKVTNNTVPLMHEVNHSAIGPFVYDERSGAEVIGNFVRPLEEKRLGIKSIAVGGGLGLLVFGGLSSMVLRVVTTSRITQHYGPVGDI